MLGPCIGQSPPTRDPSSTSWTSILSCPMQSAWLLLLFSFFCAAPRAQHLLRTMRPPSRRRTRSAAGVLAFCAPRRRLRTARRKPTVSPVYLCVCFLHRYPAACLPASCICKPWGLQAKHSAGEHGGARGAIKKSGAAEQARLSGTRSPGALRNCEAAGKL